MLRRGVVALLVLPLLAAACGGGSKHTSVASPLDAVKSSAEKTAAAGSEHLTLKASALAGGEQVSLAGSGDFDTKQRVGSLHVDLSAGGLSGSIDEVLDHTNLYLKSPLFAAMLPQGKTWLKLDLQKAGKARGVDLSSLMAQDPAQSLKALQSLRGATKVGTEQIDGVSTTHYRAQIDLSKLPAGAGVSATGPASYDVWIGDDGYVHRVKTTIAGSAGGQRSSATVTVDLSDFGKTVTVTVPAASETLEANGSIPGLGG